MNCCQFCRNLLPFFLELQEGYEAGEGEADYMDWDTLRTNQPLACSIAGEACCRFKNVKLQFLFSQERLHNFRRTDKEKRLASGFLFFFFLITSLTDLIHATSAKIETRKTAAANDLCICALAPLLLYPNIGPKYWLALGVSLAS